MYLFALSFVLFIQKLLTCKEFQLVMRGFGQKSKKHTKKLEDQIGKQKQFHSNSKKNTGVSFASYRFPIVIYSIELCSNARKLNFSHKT